MHGYRQKMSTSNILWLVLRNWKVSFFRSASNISVPQPIHTPHMGKQGQPRKNIDPRVLHKAFQKGQNISTTVLANILGIDWKTLQKQRQELGIETGYSDISDSDLDDLVQEYHQENPTGGHAYVIGHLHAMHSLCIQHQRVSASIDHIDHLGQGMQKCIGKEKKRTKYKVPQPNALWHIDGHHKLILWGIVIHGVTDGYSWKVWN